MNDCERRHYDRAFDAAIRDGCLTLEQAAGRGNRQVYARQLGARFQLPEELALRVADNRARLTDVLRAIGRIPGHPVPECSPDAPALRQRIALLIGLVALAGLLGFQQWQQQRDIGRRLEIMQLSALPTTSREIIGARTADTDRTTVATELDDQRRITKISAGRPDAVLAVFCSAAAHGGCDTMGVYPSEPPFPGRRIGRVTYQGTDRVLPIRRDRRSGRWFTGNGLAPLVSRPIDAVYRCEAGAGPDCLAVAGSAE